MLDSLVRVSRRVGEAADLLDRETRAAAESRSLYEPAYLPVGAEARTPGAAGQKTDNFIPGLRFGPNGSCRGRGGKCARETTRDRREVIADQARPTRAASKVEFPRETSRAPPFATTQFHVLLNSLFKVLFNFPSRYLFAIGLGVIFSLTRSLPGALGCTSKQPDSGEKSAQQDSRLTGLSPSTGHGHCQVGL